MWFARITFWESYWWLRSPYMYVDRKSLVINIKVYSVIERTVNVICVNHLLMVHACYSPHASIQNNYLKNRTGHKNILQFIKIPPTKRPPHSYRCNAFHLFINSKTLSNLLLQSTAQHIIQVVQISISHWKSSQKINHN